MPWQGGHRGRAGAGVPDDRRYRGAGGPGLRRGLKTPYAISYGAHFAVKKRAGTGTRVLPPEALWWVD